MKQVILLLSLLIATGTRAQKADAAVITRFYFLSGSIDKYPVTFLLHRVNEVFSGTYYYHSSGMPIEIAGKIDKKGFLKLRHMSRDEKSNEEIEGVFKDSSFSGTWVSKGKMLNFRVTSSKDVPLQFDYIWTHGEKKLKKKPEYMSHIEGLSYEATTVWPTATSPHPAKKIIQDEIRNLFNGKTSTEEIGRIMINHKNSFLNTPEDSIDQYEIGETVSIHYFDNRIISLAQDWFTYSGGAHGLYGTTYANFDLQNNRLLGLPDVLDTTAAAPSVEKILEKEFRKNFAFEEGEKLEDVLLVEKIHMSGNILLTGKGITFHYDPYVLAAYAYGSVDIFISYKDLQRWLKPEFKKLMGL